MAARVFSKEELAQLRGFPEITRDELIRFFADGGGSGVRGSRAGTLAKRSPWAGDTALYPAVAGVRAR
jgi:hypothetical protein